MHCILQFFQLSFIWGRSSLSSGVAHWCSPEGLQPLFVVGTLASFKYAHHCSSFRSTPGQLLYLTHEHLWRFDGCHCEALSQQALWWLFYLVVSCCITTYDKVGCCTTDPFPHAASEERVWKWTLCSFNNLRTSVYSLRFFSYDRWIVVTQVMWFSYLVNPCPRQALRSIVSLVLKL